MLPDTSSCCEVVSVSLFSLTNVRLTSATTMPRWKRKGNTRRSPNGLVSQKYFCPASLWTLAHLALTQDKQMHTLPFFHARMFKTTNKAHEVSIKRYFYTRHRIGARNLAHIPPPPHPSISSLYGPLCKPKCFLKLRIRSKLRKTGFTCDAKTCCCRWKGRPGAPVKLCGDDAMLVVSMVFTPAVDTAANRGPMPAAMFENAPPMLNWLGCKRNGCALPKWLKNCCPVRPVGNPKLCKWLWPMCALSVWTVKGMKLSLPIDLHSSVLGCSCRLGLLSSSPERVVLEMTVMGLCRESAWLFSVLGPPSRILLVESLLLKGCPLAGLASWSFPSSVVVEILLESGPSLMCPSLLSSSLSSSLSQKSATSSRRVGGEHQLSFCTLANHDNNNVHYQTCLSWFAQVEEEWDLQDTDTGLYELSHWQEII